MKTLIYKVEIYGENDTDQEFFSKEEDAMFIFDAKKDGLRFNYGVKEITADTDNMFSFIDNEGEYRYIIMIPVTLYNDLED